MHAVVQRGQSGSLAHKHSELNKCEGTMPGLYGCNGRVPQARTPPSLLALPQYSWQPLSRAPIRL